MAARKLRIGIIGAGMFALYFHAPALRDTGQAEITAICRRSPKHLAIAQQALGVEQAYTDWNEMLETTELDAVVISTPHHYHAEPALAALKRGLHVLVDKPMALTSSDAWQLVRAAEQANRVLMVAYATRAEPQWRWLKQQLDAGIIGQIRQISWSVTTYRRWFWQADSIPADVMEVARSVMGDLPDTFYEGWQDWHRDPAQMGGGTFPDIGVYYLDLGLWLAGAPATEIAAFSEHAGLPVECFINAQARLANGVLFSLNFADAAPQSIMAEQRQLMIVGEAGTIMDDADGQFWLYKQGIASKLVVDLPETTLASAFVSTILHGHENLSPAVDGAHVVDFMQAMYQAAAQRQIVQIEPSQQRAR